MATIAGLLTSPWVLGLIATLLVAAVAVFASGALRREAFEAELGIASLCAMKWQDFAALVGTWLAGRGLQRSGGDRKLGDGGFDLLLERGTSTYLVICRNASQQQVTGQHVGELQRTMQHEGAEGGLIVSCGPSDTVTVEQARQRGVEVIAGHALWRQIRGLVPYDVRDDAEAGAARKARQRLLLALGVAVLVGAATWFVATLLQSPAVDTPTPVARPATRAPTAAPAPTPAAAPPAAASAPAPSALPDPTLSEAQLETRRATVAMDVRSIPGVEDATWSTKSTLVIVLPAGTTNVADTFVADICRILLQYEEQRYSRLQLEIPPAAGTAAAGGDAPPSQVRWRQCR